MRRRETAILFKQLTKWAPAHKESSQQDWGGALSLKMLYQPIQNISTNSSEYFQGASSLCSLSNWDKLVPIWHLWVYLGCTHQKKWQRVRPQNQRSCWRCEIGGTWDSGIRSWKHPTLPNKDQTTLLMRIWVIMMLFSLLALVILGARTANSDRWWRWGKNQLLPGLDPLCLPHSQPC